MEKEEERQSQVAINPGIDNIDQGNPYDIEEPLLWYFKWHIIIISFFVAGPLCLLLLWFRPRTALSIKIILSVIILAITFWMIYGAVDYYRYMADYYGQLDKQMNSM